MQSRYQKTNNLVDDFGAHLTYKATDQLKFDFDAQHVKSKVDGFDLEVGLLGGQITFWIVLVESLLLHFLIQV